jgi:hypothetical protein
MDGRSPQPPVALLELLHPAGVVERSLVLGDCAPARADTAELDLLVLAPAEDRAADRAATDAAAGLADAGLAYLLASPRSRLRLLRLLAREGLRPAAAFVHVREPGGDELLVQLDRRALTYVLDTLVRPPSWLRVAARVLPDLGLRAATLLAPRVGVVVRRRSAPPLAAWLAAPPAEAAHGLILRRVRTENGGNLFVYALGSRPIIVKVRDGAAEARQLERYGAAAARAGAAVAEVVALAGGPDGAAALTLLDGVAASSALARCPDELDAVVERVTAWLERWNVATASRGVVTERLLEDELLAHVRLLEPSLRGGRHYRAWLERRASAWLGLELPLVAAHLDLTMANVLLTHNEGIAVVDWVQARAACLPLVDFFYAVADAAAAADAYGDRVAAFRSCFAGGGRWELPRRREPQLTQALDISPAVRELCFHACWLHHAANELRGGAGGPAPFARIVELVAAETSATAPP